MTVPGTCKGFNKRKFLLAKEMGLDLGFRPQAGSTMMWVKIRICSRVLC